MARFLIACMHFDPAKLINVSRLFVFVAAIAAVAAGGDFQRQAHAVDVTEADRLQLHGILNQRDYEAMLVRLRSSTGQGDAQAQHLLAAALLLGPKPFAASEQARLCESRRLLQLSTSQSVGADDALHSLLTHIRLDCDAEQPSSGTVAED